MNVFRSLGSLGVRGLLVFLSATALIGQVKPTSFCLGLDMILLNGEVSRIFLFPFVVAPGLVQGTLHFLIVALLTVIVGGACERRVGTAAFLSEILWLSLSPLPTRLCSSSLICFSRLVGLVWLSVVLFSVFSIICGFIVMTLLPALPTVLQQSAQKIPEWRPCPSGFSCVLVALSISELFHVWFVMGDQFVPAVVLSIFLPLVAAPFSLSSLLLHELGWLAGFASVYLRWRNLAPSFAWTRQLLKNALSALPGFVEQQLPEDPTSSSEGSDPAFPNEEDFDSIWDLAAQFFPMPLLRSSLRRPPPPLHPPV